MVSNANATLAGMGSEERLLPLLRLGPPSPDAGKNELRLVRVHLSQAVECVYERAREEGRSIDAGAVASASSERA